MNGHQVWSISHQFLHGFQLNTLNLLNYQHSNKDNASTTRYTSDDQSDATYIKVTTLMYISGVAISVYIATITLREIFQIHQQKWQYLLEPNNFISWILCISAAITVSPVFSAGYIDDVHFTASSITVFLSWFNLLLFLQRFDQVSVHLLVCVCECGFLLLFL